MVLTSVYLFTSPQIYKPCILDKIKLTKQLNANGLVSVQQIVNHLLLHSKCQRKLRTYIQLTKCEIKVLYLIHTIP